MVDPPSTKSDNATDCNQNNNAGENYEDVIFKWREFAEPVIKHFPEMKTPDDFKTPEEFKNYVLYHLYQLNPTPPKFTPLKLIALNTHMLSVSTLTATSAQQPHTPR